MTGRAIRIATQGLGRIRAGILAVGRLVLMRMVAEVLGRGPGFMLAITGHSRPTELERQEHQQDDSQPFAHRGNSIAATGFTLPLLAAWVFSEPRARSVPPLRFILHQIRAASIFGELWPL